MVTRNHFWQKSFQNISCPFFVLVNIIHEIELIFCWFLHNKTNILHSFNPTNSTSCWVFLLKARIGWTSKNSKSDATSGKFHAWNFVSRTYLFKIMFKIYLQSIHISYKWNINELHIYTLVLALKIFHCL